jgi:hypothetical protein
MRLHLFPGQEGSFAHRERVAASVLYRNGMVTGFVPPPTRSARWPRSPCGSRGTSADRGSGGQGAPHGIRRKPNAFMWISAGWRFASSSGKTYMFTWITLPSR